MDNDHYIMEGRVNDDLLEFARAWKGGYTLPVHPTVGRRLNACLVQAGEDPVPFSRATDERARSLSELLFHEHVRASDTPDLSGLFRSTVVPASIERERA